MSSDGDVTVPITLPAGLVAGSYTLEVVSDSITLGATLTVQGPPIEPDEDGGERDEEDPLLVPLPSGWGRGITGAGPTAPGSTAAPAPQVTPSGMEPATAGSIAVVAGLMVLAGIALTALMVRAARR